MFAAAISLFGLLSAISAESPVPVAPVPWELTGTSSTAEVPEGGTGYRVERRAFRKKQRLMAKTGFSYLARGDYYTSPGVALDLSYYPDEVVGLDLFSGTLFFSDLTNAAATLRRQVGFLPDSQKPIARLTTGARLAFAYGKLFIESMDAVIHMDASLSIHGGVLVTERAPNVGGDVGLGLQAAAASHFVVFLQAAWFVSYEKRTTSIAASGLLATAGAGVLF